MVEYGDCTRSSVGLERFPAKEEVARSNRTECTNGCYIIGSCCFMVGCTEWRGTEVVVTGRSRKAKWTQVHHGFESHPLRPFVILRTSQCNL